MRKMKAFLAQVNPILGDIEGNVKKIIDSIQKAKAFDAKIVLFPELVITGYFPDDLLLQPSFIDAVEKALELIIPESQGLFIALGLPRRSFKEEEKPLYNSAAILIDGSLAGYQDKRLLPTYDVFDERRYFEPGKEQKIFDFLGLKIAVTICEDLWQHAKAVKETHYPVDPVEELKGKGIDFLCNLSGSPYSFHKKKMRFEVFQKAAQTLRVPLLFCNQVGANDELIFDGHSFFLNEEGSLVQMANGFVEEDFGIDLERKENISWMENPIEDLFKALVLGVKDYFHKQGFQKAFLGLSGGIDSALVAVIAKEALGKDQVTALNLSSRYNRESGRNDARKLAENLGIYFQEISIDEIFQNYLDLLKPLFHRLPADITEQNLQSRIRGMVLMAFANEYKALLLNTGNKSEMAMGYATLYGDMAGALGVLQDVTKIYIYQLAEYVNREQEIIPQSIIDKVPSAELKEDQTDFDTLPPFELLDPILEDYLEKEMSIEEIAEKHHLPLSFVAPLIHKIHQNEYKRRQTPIGLRVTSKAFSKGRVVPIVQKWR